MSTSSDYPTDLIPIGSRVRITSDILGSWNGQTGIVSAYRSGNPFRYWVTMTILHPVLKQPITIDGQIQELPQMFAPEEIVLDPEDHNATS